ncbi:hypothetical protein NR798_06210 [Archangium gephyra]|uniref:hypothetical protein n=1 Tax=Archangium gephyra TaxID=48 RepID=UPI0035D4E53B
MSSEYVLRAVMKLKPNRLLEFQQYSQKLMPAYVEQLQWKLLTACHTEDGAAGCEVMNVWLLPTQPEVAMNEWKVFFEKHPDYAAISALLKDCCETQTPTTMKLAPYQPRVD